MPGFPRLVLIALGMLIAVIGSGGAPDGEGADDVTGGILILIARGWPKATYRLSAGDSTYELQARRWPPVRKILRKIVQDFGGDHAARVPIALDWDGLVVRSWSSPFPTSWAKGRQYDEHEVEQEKARLMKAYATAPTDTA